MSETATINTDRFYLCDNGDAEDAFTVCGPCAQERNPSLYDELVPIPDHAPDIARRECVHCGQTEAELRGGR